MSEDGTGRLDELAVALKAAQAEKAEAYVQLDWTRVWELTNVDIPKLEKEIAALRPFSPESEASAHPVPPIDFAELLIELVQERGGRLHLSFRRHPTAHARAKVSVVFCDEQKKIIDSMLEHVVFYQSHGEKQVKVKDLLNGPWLSDRMNEQDANITAENARDGINDLRLIIHHRLGQI